MIGQIGAGQTRELLRALSSPRRFGPGPRITIPARGNGKAAPEGLTQVRTRSHAQTFPNSLQTERHPHKKLGLTVASEKVEGKDRVYRIEH
jgi:hypothetical protein